MTPLLDPVLAGDAVVDATQALVGDFAPLFALLTQLGDVWFLVLVLSLAYWLGDRTPVLGAGLDRRRVAFVVAIAVGALALVVGLKHLFAIPRPPGARRPVAVDAVPPPLRDLYAWAATADGYGFPSGHALGTTAIWGGLAWVSDRETRRRRLLAAAVVVALVSLSRVVLGVHYPGDVLGGVLIGLGYLALVRWVAWADPTRAFGLGLGLALATVLLVGATHEPLQVLGFGMGGLLAWVVVRDRLRPHPSSGRTAAATVGLGTVLVGTAFALTEALAASPVAAGFASALLVTGVLTLPLAIERTAEKSET